MKTYFFYFCIIIFIVWVSNLIKDFRQKKIQKISDLYISFISLIVACIISYLIYKNIE